MSSCLSCADCGPNERHRSWNLPPRSWASEFPCGQVMVRQGRLTRGKEATMKRSDIQGSPSPNGSGTRRGEEKNHRRNAKNVQDRTAKNPTEPPQVVQQ